MFLCFLLFSNFSCQKDEPVTVKTKEELDAKLQEELDDNNLTSISYCVVKNNKILHSNALGFADEKNRKLSTDTSRYLIASISKTITAVAVMQLIEQNVISIDDDINSFLPFSVRNPHFPNTKITYRMLLSHTSSISDDFQNTLELYCFGTDCSMTLAQFFNEVFIENRTYFSSDNFSKKEPGTKENYSNLAYALLGYLVERIAHTPFDEYCKANIFNPLKMNKTEWRLSNTPLAELAIPYSSDISDPNPHYTFPDYPNGGLRTNVLDLSKFLRAVIQNGTFNGTQLLSSSTMDVMKTLQFGSSEQCISFYYDTNDDRKILGHNGGEMGVSTEMFFDPNTNLGVIVFNNNDDANLETIISLLFNYGENQEQF